MMTSKDLIQKTEAELTKLASDARAEIRDLRFKISARQHAKVRSIRDLKRDLARILTALKSKTDSSLTNV